MVTVIYDWDDGSLCGLYLLISPGFLFLFCQGVAASLIYLLYVKSNFHLYDINSLAKKSYSALDILMLYVAC